MKLKASLSLTLLLLSLALPLIAAPIPVDIKKDVVFIYYLNKITNASPDGTGFLIALQDAKNANSGWLYLVTAKHVLRPPDINAWLNEVGVRLNRRDGASEIVPMSLKVDGPNRNVFTNDDPTVDIAVAGCSIDLGKYDIKFLKNEDILTDKDIQDLNVNDGTEVFFTGMFSYIAFRENPNSLKQFTPITRFGKISSMPSEKVDWVFGKTELYLAEVTCYPGNSGSPVYVHIGMERQNGIVLGGPTFKLAGVMSGYFGEPSYLNTASVSTNQFVSVNNGIAAIVPASKITEILNSPILRQQRHEQ